MSQGVWRGAGADSLLRRFRVDVGGEAPLLPGMREEIKDPAGGPEPAAVHSARCCEGRSLRQITEGGSTLSPARRGRA
jgi:hypothetical protein